MSQQSSGHDLGSGAGSRTEPAPSQVARDEVAGVSRTTTNAGKEVAGTAVEQAKQVAREAETQARDLIGEARTQVRSQAQTGQRKAAETLRDLADELRQMAQSGSQSGPAGEVVRQAADKLTGVADWIGQREPSDLLEEVRGMARRRPGMFLLGAAASGVLVGRLTRGVAQAATRGSDQGSAPHQAPAAAEYPPGPMPDGRSGEAPLPRGATAAPPGPPPVAPGPPAPPTDPAYAPGPGATSVGEQIDKPKRRPAGRRTQGGPL